MLVAAIGPEQLWLVEVLVGSKERAIVPNKIS